MVGIARDVVDDDERVQGGVELHGSRDLDRRREAAIAGVADRERMARTVDAKDGFEGPRVVAQAPEVMWLSEPVQLLAVHLDGVVRRRRPEPIPPLGRARVGVGAGVEEQRDAGERCVERRDVVVAVAAAAGEPDGTAVDEDVVLVPPQDRAAAVGEELRARRRRLDERRGSGGPEQPGDLAARARDGTSAPQAAAIAAPR